MRQGNRRAHDVVAVFAGAATEEARALSRLVHVDPLLERSVPAFEGTLKRQRD